MDERFTTHGDFSWSELMTTDIEGAKAFYGGVFGWTFEQASVTDEPYNEVKTGGKGVGGLMGMPPDAPPGMPPCWTTYVTVADLDAVIAKVNELGGAIVHGPMDIPKVGRLCVIQDPQGATLAAIQYAMEG